MALPNPNPGDLLTLDWSEWERQGIPRRDETDTASKIYADCAEGSEGTAGCQQEIRQLVKDCAARLQLPGNLCFGSEQKEEPILEHDYRMPLMESGSVACGFEVRLL